jgi:hypothetical protein
MFHANFSIFQNSVIKPINEYENVDYIDEVRYSKKRNLCFRCLICINDNGNHVRAVAEHLSSSRHTKNYAKLVAYKDEYDKYRLETFKKFYSESYLSLKHEFFRQRWRHALEVYLETGSWLNKSYHEFRISNLIQKKLDALKFREKMALLELCVIKCFVKRRFDSLEDMHNFDNVADDGTLDYFTTLRMSLVNQILVFVLPFLDKI